MLKMFVQLQDMHKYIKQVPKLSLIDDSVRQSIITLANQNLEDAKIKNIKQWFTLIYFDPHSIFCGIWNLVMILVVYMIQLQISLIMGFSLVLLQDQRHVDILIPFVYSIIVVLWVDIFINFNKGYYAEGEGKVINSPRKIIERYLKSYFTIDLICIAFLFLIPNCNNYWVNFLQIIPLILFWIRKFRAQSQIQVLLQYHKITRIVFIIVMLFIDVFILAHFGACIFAGMDLVLWKVQYYQDNTQYYWLSNDTSYSVDLLPGYWMIQYIYAMSFSLGTLSTLAPGPFGKNPYENFFMIVLMTYFMILASYSGDVLVNLFFYQSQKRVFHQNNIIQFDKLMELKKVTNQLKERVHNFFQLIWEFQVKMQVDAKKMLIEKLPTKLKNKLKLEMNFVKMIKFIDYLPYYSDISIQISNLITQTIFQPSQYIFQSNQPGTQIQSRSLLFIKQGLAQFYLQKRIQSSRQHILSFSNVAGLIGAYQFITGLLYSISCKPIDLCVVDRLAYQDFKSLIINYSLTQQVSVIREDVMIGGDLHKINKTCVICMGEHLERKCDQIYVDTMIFNAVADNHFTKNNKRVKNVRANNMSKKIHFMGLRKKQKKQKTKMTTLEFMESFLGVLMKENAEHFKIDTINNFDTYRTEYNI